jgi:hypothetical protein
MMDNITTFRIELDVASQKVIHQFMMHNEHVEDQIRNAIKATVESFDFEKEIRIVAEQQIRKAIRDAMNYGPLEQLVREKTQSIYTELIENEFAKYTKP